MYSFIVLLLLSTQLNIPTVSCVLRMKSFPKLRCDTKLLYSSESFPLNTLQAYWWNETNCISGSWFWNNLVIQFNKYSIQLVQVSYCISSEGKWLTSEFQVTVIVLQAHRLVIYLDTPQLIDLVVYAEKKNSIPCYVSLLHSSSAVINERHRIWIKIWSKQNNCCDTKECISSLLLPSSQLQTGL